MTKIGSVHHRYGTAVVRTAIQTANQVHDTLYVELFVLKAICQWCVVSAVLTTLVLASEGVLVGRMLTASARGEIEAAAPAPRP